MALATAMMGGGVLLMMMDGVYQIVSTKIGQNTLGLADRLLCIAEALNFFSMPKDQQMEVLKEAKGGMEYKRPLPWILYIPMLFYCRLVRWVIAVLGAPFQFKMDAVIAVAYLQSWRRKLRYYKIQGLRIMNDPKPMATSLPWFLVWAINLFVWGPLQLITFFDKIFFRNKSFGYYAATAAQPRSRRLLKKLKATDNNECSTSDLLDKFAEDDDNDPANDPDFEVKSTDLLSDTEEEEDDDEEEENSEPEGDTKVRENGGGHKENGGGGEGGGGGAGDHQQQQHNQENNQNPEGDHEQHRQQENHGQSEENHQEQHQQHHHHY